MIRVIWIITYYLFSCELFSILILGRGEDGILILFHKINPSEGPLEKAKIT